MPSLKLEEIFKWPSTEALNSINMACMNTDCRFSAPTEDLLVKHKRKCR